MLAHGEEVPPQVKGGVIGGKSENHKGPRKKPEPKPETKSAADSLVIDGQALRYLRGLAIEMTRGSIDNRLDMRDRISELVAFLVLEDSENG